MLIFEDHNPDEGYSIRVSRDKAKGYRIDLIDWTDKEIVGTWYRPDEDAAVKLAYAVLYS